ncbi:hypothetical protein P8452_44921 [Trifolium repens]|nr:hypothetical protein P8452_44921 [Trifolium repens]
MIHHQVITFNKRMMKLLNVLFLVLCLMTNSIGHKVDDIHSVLESDLERQLNLINKSHIKSIQTKSGYLVDCVDINKQPAFDHPLLKNHQLQRKPSFERKINETRAKISSTKLTNWLEKVRCPKGYVPIRRITKNDLIRGKSLLNHHSLFQNNSVTHAATVQNIVTSISIYGVKGITSIYNPKVNKDQLSSSYLYVRNGDTNEIRVGWHVYPELYNGDDSTYFFALWMSDVSKNHGCYNMLCNGFVQTDTSYYLGSRIAKTSTYDGEMIEMPISLNQDIKSHNWWLTVADKRIGYFPNALFSNMGTGDFMGWAGLTVTPPGVSSPSMGSGHFPDKDFIHACYFRNVGYQLDESQKYYEPEVDAVQAYSSAPNCYGVEYYGDQGEEFGYALQFGGPGGGNCHL